MIEIRCTFEDDGWCQVHNRREQIVEGRCLDGVLEYLEDANENQFAHWVVARYLVVQYEQWAKAQQAKEKRPGGGLTDAEQATLDGIQERLRRKS